MITLTDADNVLKNVYLDVICDQMNNKTNPFYAAIKKGSEDICGKQAILTCRYGINGGMGSATESGNLPISGGNNYISLTAELKNIYGTIEISDKALRASQNSASAMVNVLNAEMDGLLEAAKYNFGRMLWQSGDGVIGKVGSLTGHTVKHYYPVADLRMFVEGMIIDFISVANDTVLSSGHKIIKIDKATNRIYIAPSVGASVTIAENDLITMQQSYQSEINGMPYIFDDTIGEFYGNARSMIKPILPLSKTHNAVITTDAMQETLDDIEQKSGNDVNMILMSYAVRRKYLSYLQSTRSNIDYLNLDGGFKTLAYNGIPVVADKFCLDNNMYFINTNDFKLVQLGDWQWIEGENGKVLMQLDKSPSYMGTLVKYANLVCSRPAGQARMTGITVG